MSDPITLDVDGREVTVPADGTLLDALRDVVGERSPKDGCSPQGQCGCCTVLVDGAPRVACVTPVRRVRGRAVTTAEHVDDAARWADAFCSTGASQCGFCTPGIVARLAGLAAKRPDADHAAVEQALLAHLCRCTGWRTILDAWDAFHRAGPIELDDRDLAAAARRAELEGGRPQRVAPDVALGHGGFAEDTAPPDSLVALLDPEGRWTLGESVAAARQAADAVQGRRTTVDARPALDLPPGDWDLVLQTSWVEPAYLETDASWSEPGGRPADPLANGGAFGAKEHTPVADEARRLADEAGAPVRARYRREDTVRLGPKRPPLAAGLRADGTGVVRIARTPGAADIVKAVLPAVTVEEVDVAGPPTSVDLRGAVWVEATALAIAVAQLAGARAERGRPAPGLEIGPVTDPGGGRAWAHVDAAGVVHVAVEAGDPLDEVTLRSYCIGAAHQALSMVTSEALTVDDDGAVHDLTIRSFGVLRAVDTPPIEVEVRTTPGEPVRASVAVTAAVAAAIWLAQGLPAAWPTGAPPRPTGKMAP